MGHCLLIFSFFFFFAEPSRNYLPEAILRLCDFFSPLFKSCWITTSLIDQGRNIILLFPGSRLNLMHLQEKNSCCCFQMKYGYVVLGIWSAYKEKKSAVGLIVVVMNDPKMILFCLKSFLRSVDFSCDSSLKNWFGFADTLRSFQSCFSHSWMLAGFFLQTFWEFDEAKLGPNSLCFLSKGIFFNMDIFSIYWITYSCLSLF